MLTIFHLYFVTMVKKNRKFKLTGSNSPIRADELAQSFRHDQYRYYPSVGFYIMSMVLELTNYGSVRLSIVKNDRRAAINDTRFIITNMLDLTAAGVVQNYLQSTSTIESGDKVFTVYTSLSKGEFMQKVISKDSIRTTIFENFAA